MPGRKRLPECEIVLGAVPIGTTIYFKRNVAPYVTTTVLRFWRCKWCGKAIKPGNKTPKCHETDREATFDERQFNRREHDHWGPELLPLEE